MKKRVQMICFLRAWIVVRWSFITEFNSSIFESFTPISRWFLLNKSIKDLNSISAERFTVDTNLSSISICLISRLSRLISVSKIWISFSYSLKWDYVEIDKMLSDDVYLLSKWTGVSSRAKIKPIIVLYTNLIAWF